MEQELLTFPEHPSSPPDFGGVRVTLFLALYVCFVLFLSAIVFSVLPYTDSDYSFGIFKLFLRFYGGCINNKLFRIR